MRGETARHSVPASPTRDVSPAPLRILHVTPYSPSAWAYGGIPRLVGTLARELARLGHDVTVCATDACTDAKRLPKSAATRPGLHPWPPHRTSEGVEWRVFPNMSNRLAYHWQFFTPLGLGRYLREQAASFDVAHLHACRNLPGALAASHLRKAGVPYVLAPNGTGPRIERRRLLKQVFDLVAGQRVMREAACVLAVSQAEQRQLTALGVPASSIRVIPNPVDLDEFAPLIAPGRFRARLGLGNEPVVLYLGRLSPRKRLDVLIRAFASVTVKDRRLVIAGNDMGAGESARALVSALGLESQTIFTGLLQGRERLEALADATVLVYPAEHEVFGLVPLEALLAGTPVVVAGDSGCGEVVSLMGGGQVVPCGNVGALARALAVALNHSFRWRVEAVNAGLRVRSTYGGSAVAFQIAEMYRALLS